MSVIRTREVEPEYLGEQSSMNEPGWQQRLRRGDKDHHDALQPAHVHSRFHRLRLYAEARERRTEEWAQIENQAAATYMWCEAYSNNWTTGTFPQEPVPFDCSCSPEEVSPRLVDLIDLQQRTTQGKSIPFCNCTSDVIRLLHYGFVASSAKRPRTAFSIPLLQFHYKLWQSTTVSTSGFTKALSAFFDSRHKKPLLARGSTKSRNFRLPFTYSSDLYCRILILKEQLLQEGLQTTNEQKWASKCPRCFGPRENEVKVDPDEPDFIIAMDGNYQQRHYAHASKDSPSNAQYPPTFLPPSEVNTSEALCESTDANVSGIEDPSGLNETAGEWLLSKFASADDIIKTARIALDALNQLSNPHSVTAGTYTDDFFQQQWEDERAYHLETTQSYQEKQKKELGQLLCLEEQLETEW
ncbi:hypothetical protein PtB15_4B104 [Puccinia triticina]|nr:hypothetical protein PtB15_4B104 [Puccinia triticina]